MEKLRRLLRRIRVVYRRSSRLTKTVVLSAVVLSMAALLTLHLTAGALQARAEELKDEAARLEQENQQLESNIDGLGSADSVEQIAGDELGLVDPNTVVIHPEP
ncbi:MAG: septum formation initiator family protein [Firmicutes bacterium]|nr:septum formation initiator family protein [Bacillota bacterium]